MLETKQLQYFAICAECRSFSEAAEILYTTQSNVSKIISRMEAQLGFSLFKRDAAGISLSARGEQLYQRAAALLTELESLEKETLLSRNAAVRIASNPSSWFARTFSSFYDIHRDENIRYNIHTGTTEQIVERMRKMEDEIAFVYIFPELQPRFLYDRKRYGLEFELLTETDGMLYFSTEDANPGEMPDFEEAAASGFVQGETDGAFWRREWSRADGTLFKMPQEPAVTTNSDYIMNIMMKKNRLANISAACFAAYEEGKAPGFPLKDSGRKILYGALWNPAADLSDTAAELKDYIRVNIIGGNRWEF